MIKLNNILKQILKEQFNAPSIFARQRLHNIVKRLIDDFEGGPEFFHALDAEIKKISNEDLIIELLSGCKNQYVCSSGGFGSKVQSLIDDGKIKCKGFVSFNGKIIEKRLGVRSWIPQNFDFNNKAFIYVDDSYFSGRTSSMINKFLKKHNSYIKDIYVIYDGSINGKVKSFYSYYNDTI